MGVVGHHLGVWERAMHLPGHVGQRAVVTTSVCTLAAAGRALSSPAPSCPMPCHALSWPTLPFLAVVLSPPNTMRSHAFLCVTPPRHATVCHVTSCALHSWNALSTPSSPASPLPPPPPQITLHCIPQYNVSPQRLPTAALLCPACAQCPTLLAPFAVGLPCPS